VFIVFLVSVNWYFYLFFLKESTISTYPKFTFELVLELLRQSYHLYPSTKQIYYWKNSIISYHLLHLMTSPKLKRFKKIVSWKS